MSSDGAEKPKKFSPGRSHAWENYEVFKNSDDEEEMQNDVFAPMEPSLEELRKLRDDRGKAPASEQVEPEGEFQTNLLRILDKKQLKRAEEREPLIRISAIARAQREADLFSEGVQKPKEEDVPLIEAYPEEFGIGPTTLAHLVRQHDLNSLQQLGGVNKVANLLHTDLEKGIKEVPEEIQRRVNVYGENSYPRKGARNFSVFVWEALQDTTLIILMVCATLSLVFGITTEGIKEGWFDGGSLYFTVILVILVIAISNYRQSLQFQKSLQFQNLNEKNKNIQLQVIRGGRRSEISIFDLVVGDVVPLNIGDQVPADGILIEGHSLSIDESSMTGESKFVYKDKKNPLMISGCKVADGYGTMLVTAVGLNSNWGLVMASISEENEKTPLQVRLKAVASFIGSVGLAVAVLVFVILLVRFFTGHTEDSNGNPMFQVGKTKVGAAFNGIIKIFAITVTIVVVVVPEGLPLAVTLTLAYSMRKMMADKALVRRLSACETMGSATTICIKTGTLTMNQMTVVKVCIGGDIREPLDSSKSLPYVVQALLVEGISRNTTGSVYKPEDSDDRDNVLLFEDFSMTNIYAAPEVCHQMLRSSSSGSKFPEGNRLLYCHHNRGGGEMEVTGSPTEKAILSWALKLGMNFDVERSKSSILHVFTFNSERKRGGVALKKYDTVVHIHWKGAAEIILGLCKTWIDSSGSLQKMTFNKVYENKQIIEGMAAAKLQCIAFAYRTYDLASVPVDEEQIQSWQIPEDDLTLLAIVGMKDPCRPNIREAVNTCQKAGVKVRMVTGDNIYTAKAIASECGILEIGQFAEEPTIIEGRVFRNYTEAERLEIVDKICVMGRSSPTDKLLLVQALRKIGHVVAVTGDGTNDAPALHEADIGLSMGIQGTEVAKESSDIIILDDNFASVVKVVRWGRSVYANIQKFIQFLLTPIISTLLISVVAAVSSGEVPLTAIQLLWVNVIMDTLGPLALATEAPTDHLMNRPPVGRREPLITNCMWRNIIVQAFYQVAALLILILRGNDILNLNHYNTAHANKVRNTVIFNADILLQIFNEFNSTKPDRINMFRGLLSNHLFVVIISFKLVFQVLIVEFSWEIASTTPLSWKQWIICIVIGLISWPLAAIVKLIPVRETPFVDYLMLTKPRRKHSSEPRSILDGKAEVNVEQDHLLDNEL